jgi:hypothetical protein
MDATCEVVPIMIYSDSFDRRYQKMHLITFSMSVLIDEKVLWKCALHDSGYWVELDPNSVAAHEISLILMQLYYLLP